MFRLGTGAGLCALVIMLVASGPASAATCYSSTPNSGSYFDPNGDGEGGVAPEITSGTIATDASCNFTASYTIVNQAALVSGDILVWFINTDNNTATGSGGADYAMGRGSSGYVDLSRYNAATDAFESVKQGESIGAFGVRTNLGDFDPSTVTTFRVEGASIWTSSATGTSYYDFAPNIGDVPFAVQFSSSPPPPPAATPPPPQPAPQPALQPRSASVCKVPRLKGLKLTQAKKRLRSANCSVGKIRYVRSLRLVGRVSSTKPGRGRTLRKGAKVNLFVGRRLASARSASLASDAARLVTAINKLSRQR